MTGKISSSSSVDCQKELAVSNEMSLVRSWYLTLGQARPSESSQFEGRSLRKAKISLLTFESLVKFPRLVKLLIQKVRSVRHPHASQSLNFNAATISPHQRVQLCCVEFCKWLSRWRLQKINDDQGIAVQRLVWSCQVGKFTKFSESSNIFLEKKNKNNTIIKWSWWASEMVRWSDGHLETLGEGASLTTRNTRDAETGSTWTNEL